MAEEWTVEGWKESIEEWETKAPPRVSFAGDGFLRWLHAVASCGGFMQWLLAVASS